MSRTAIGELSQTSECVKIQWTMKDIFAYTKENECCYSPCFSIPDSKWYLSFCPNGDTRTDSVGWLSLYLNREKNATVPKSVNFTFGIKKVDGTIETIGSDMNFVFGFKDFEFGCAKFLDRTKLQLRKSQLAPTGALTLTCIMRLNDSLESISRFIKLSKNFEDMLISKKGCDATLKVKQEEFPVHKSILGSRSPVFEAMFEVDMKEKNTGTVNIVDCHPGAFKDFLAYIYSGKFTNSSDNVFQLYRIAHKYDVEELKSDCVLYMMNNLTVDILFDAAIIGHQFDESELKCKTQDFFTEKFTEIAPTEQWDTFLIENVPLANQLLKNMAAKMKPTK